jgi:hypothetical protein
MMKDKLLYFFARKTLQQAGQVYFILVKNTVKSFS